MNTLKTFFSELRNDEDGASFLEYTVLLGIILAVSIGILTLVGQNAEAIWDTMLDHMQTAAGDTAVTAPD